MQRGRTSGTLERLLTTPMGKLDLLGGYAVAFSTAAAAQAALACAVAFGFRGLTTEGSVTWVLLIAVPNAILGVRPARTVAGRRNAEAPHTMTDPATRADTAPGLRTGRRPDTRSRILSTARKLFAQTGFDKTSVRSVATGRRPGNPDTRSRILSTARKLFAQTGFDRTSVRSVATGAGIDPALVHQNFGTERELFLASVDIPVDPPKVIAPVLDTPPDEIGNRLALAVFSVWESPHKPAVVAAFRSAMAGNEPTLLRTFLLEVVLRDLGPRVDDLVAIVAPTLQRYLTVDLPV